MLLPLTVGETHYLIDTGTAHAALRDFEVIKESALYWGNTSSYRAILVIVASDLLHIYKHYCCGATAGSEQQHNQDLKEIYKGRRILEFITFYHNALHLTTLFTTMHCI